MNRNRDQSVFELGERRGGPIDGARAVVNLAGRSVNCRYTEENRCEIVESRVDSVRAIAEAIRRAGAPPGLRDDVHELEHRLTFFPGARNVHL